MEEDYDYDEDQFLEYDGDWIFVEDEYGLADELAESQVPEPGYSGTNAEIALESFDYDIYNYWDDVDYLADDAYWDYEGKVLPGEDLQSSGQKRKRGTPARASAASKRRKVSGKDVAEGAVPGRGQMDNVMFVSREEQVRLALQRGPILKRSKPVAFLGDWRKRYANVDGEVLVGQMPADMKKAAQAEDAVRGQTPDQEIASAAGPGSQEDEEGWEDEEEENASTAGDAVEGLPSLDPDMLKQILRQRMGDAGLDGMDEGAFMDTISKMLAGGSDEDDVAGDLANILLGQATERGGNSALSDWLSGQGVSLDAAEEDETSSNAEADISHGGGQSSVPGSAAASRTSPLDSAIALESSEASRETVTPTNSRAKDAQRRRDTVGGRKKRPAKQVAFDEPSGEEPKINIEPTEEKRRDDEEAPKSEAPTPARSTRSKSVNSPAPSKKNTRSNDKANKEQQLQHEQQDDARVSAANDPAPTTSTGKGRKRKAADDDEVSQIDNKGNRKAKEPATRRTRSARAKTGGT
ncbi:hypothetical protein KC343_g13369 [Hortaea werneckii]|uniref:Uncharacterized protein n=1 Tax=Hortaea werneckii TaxID=91943 RepID=A0A3M7F8M7_HORWE|nr:hypothetical protein KC352_g31623 [Hortaea werneckii]KAI7544499.1 hypothetical protein KC317_g16000 [Hortaea werneckii]KAI7593293.1 hypothetical protein KC346_g15879 [Hortaea werneckii]KAI7606558.1 hypothetical protein KC343_g13369 [Hortaea werneckii]KAI7642402.1 hypothetical protein KC319_g13063 [Hortaea werneckii]